MLLLSCGIFFSLTGCCQSFIIQARARTFVIRLRDDEAKNKILRNKVVVGFFFLSDFFLDRLTVRWRGLAETDEIYAATPRLQLFPLLPITKQNKSFFFWLREITPFYFFSSLEGGSVRLQPTSRTKPEEKGALLLLLFAPNCLVSLLTTSRIQYEVLFLIGGRNSASVKRFFMA